jgi:hypothetical protein
MTVPVMPSFREGYDLLLLIQQLFWELCLQRKK